MAKETAGDGEADRLKESINAGSPGAMSDLRSGAGWTRSWQTLEVGRAQLMGTNRASGKKGSANAKRVV